MNHEQPSPLSDRFAENQVGPLDSSLEVAQEPIVVTVAHSQRWERKHRNALSKEQARNYALIVSLILTGVAAYTVPHLIFRTP